jgi:hypothetical protein
MNNIKTNNFNPSSLKTDQDINEMLVDSDLIVLQSNYNYMVWGILGVSILFITINIMKK